MVDQVSRASPDIPQLPGLVLRRGLGVTGPLAHGCPSHPSLLGAARAPVQGDNGRQPAELWPLSVLWPNPLPGLLRSAEQGDEHHPPQLRFGEEGAFPARDTPADHGYHLAHREQRVRAGGAHDFPPGARAAPALDGVAAAADRGAPAVVYPGPELPDGGGRYLHARYKGDLEGRGARDVLYHPNPLATGGDPGELPILGRL